MKVFISLLLALVFFSCAKKNIPTANSNQSSNAEYSEDLTEFRAMLNESNENGNVENATPKIELTSQPLYINEKVDAIIDRKAEKNRAIKYANGYRIQLYVGRDRKTLEETKAFASQAYPNLTPYLTFSLPIYKLKIGDFLTKPDAERLLNQLKDQFPDAILVSEKIDIKKVFLKE